jgi:hypothetical protein
MEAINITTEQAAKMDKMLRLLDSPMEGEVLAALSAIKRMLSGSGLSVGEFLSHRRIDLHSFCQQKSSCSEPPSTKPRYPPPSEAPRKEYRLYNGPDLERCVSEVLNNHRTNLNDNTVNFMHQMLAYSRRFKVVRVSLKQSSWLKGVMQSCGQVLQELPHG